MRASFLSWVLCHYRNNYVAIFKANVTPERLKLEAEAYIWLTDLLGLLRNDTKDTQGTAVIVFGIEIDTSSVTARLLIDKLEKAIKVTAKILNQKSISFIDMQLLIGFLSFCSQAVKLGRVFTRRLWDFTNHYPCNGPRTTLKKIPAWVREDLEWWKKLLSI